jgi:hypothetical protein
MQLALRRRGLIEDLDGENLNFDHYDLQSELTSFFFVFSKTSENDHRRCYIIRRLRVGPSDSAARIGIVAYPECNVFGPRPDPGVYASHNHFISRSQTLRDSREENCEYMAKPQ